MNVSVEKIAQAILDQGVIPTPDTILENLNEEYDFTGRILEQMQSLQDAQANQIDGIIHKAKREHKDRIMAHRRQIEHNKAEVTKHVVKFCSLMHAVLEYLTNDLPPLEEFTKEALDTSVEDRWGEEFDLWNMPRTKDWMFIPETHRGVYIWCANGRNHRHKPFPETNYGLAYNSASSVRMEDYVTRLIEKLVRDGRL